MGERKKLSHINNSGGIIMNKLYELDNCKNVKGILAGMLIGDGGIAKHDNFYITHSIKQEDYIIFKKELLEKITNKPVNIRYWDNLFNNKYYPLVRIEPKTSVITKQLVHLIAPYKKKIITSELLNLLTIQGIAIWYMDDGSCTNVLHKEGGYGGALIYLNTYLPIEENQFIIEYFKNKYNINWYLNKSKGKYRLVMRTKEGRKFMDLIRDYIIDSMKYKTHIGKQYCM